MGPSAAIAIIPAAPSGSKFKSAGLVIDKAAISIHIDVAGGFIVAWFDVGQTGFWRSSFGSGECLSEILLRLISIRPFEGSFSHILAEVFLGSELSFRFNTHQHLEGRVLGFQLVETFSKESFIDAFFHGTGDSNLEVSGYVIFT